VDPAVCRMGRFQSRTWLAAVYVLSLSRASEQSDLACDDVFSPPTYSPTYLAGLDAPQRPAVRRKRPVVTTLRVATCAVRGASIGHWDANASLLAQLWERSAQAIGSASDVEIAALVNFCAEEDLIGRQAKFDAYKRFANSLPPSDLLLLTGVDVVFNGGRFNAAQIVSRWEQARNGRDILILQAENTTHDLNWASPGLLGYAGEMGYMFSWLQWFDVQEVRALDAHGCNPDAGDAKAAAAAEGRAYWKFASLHQDMLQADELGVVFGNLPELQLSCKHRDCVQITNESSTASLSVDDECSLVLDAPSSLIGDPVIWHSAGSIRKRVLGTVFGQIHSCLIQNSPPVPGRLIYINLDSPVGSLLQSKIPGPEQRNVRMQEQLFDYPGMIERMPAVTGTDVTQGKFARFVDELGIHDNLYTLYRNEPDAINKTVACWLSHVSILERLVNELAPDETALMMEDDVIFPDGWVDRLQTYFQHAPEDWDLLKFCWYGHARSDDAVNEYWFHVTPPFNDGYGTFFYGGSCGSLVRGSSVRRVLQQLQTQPISHYDTNLLAAGAGLKDFRMYASRQKLLLVDDALPNTIRVSTAANEEEALTRFTRYVKESDNASCKDEFATNDGNTTWQPFLALFNRTQDAFMKDISSFAVAFELDHILTWTLGKLDLTSKLCPAAAALAMLLQSCKTLLALLPLSSMETPQDLLDPYVQEATDKMLSAFKLAERPPWHGEGLQILLGFYHYFKKLLTGIRIASRESWLGPTRRWQLDKHLWRWFKMLRPSAVVQFSPAIAASPQHRPDEAHMRTAWRSLAVAFHQVTTAMGKDIEWWPIGAGLNGVRPLSSVDFAGAARQDDSADIVSGDIEIITVLASPGDWWNFGRAMSTALWDYGWTGCKQQLVNRHANSTCLSPSSCGSHLVCSHSGTATSGDIRLRVLWTRPVEVLPPSGVLPQHAAGRVRVLDSTSMTADITDELYCLPEGCWSTSKLFRPWPGAVLPQSLRWPQGRCDAWGTEVPCPGSVAEIAQQMSTWKRMNSWRTSPLAPRIPQRPCVVAGKHVNVVQFGRRLSSALD